jgi:hypothetical protein
VLYAAFLPNGNLMVPQTATGNDGRTLAYAATQRGERLNGHVVDAPCMQSELSS